MSSPDPRAVARAIIVYTGWGEEVSPVQDPERIVEEFGAHEAQELVPAVISLEGDFYASNAENRTNDLSEMARLASADFQAKHPEISADAVKAFAWCYTYSYK